MGNLGLVLLIVCSGLIPESSGPGPAGVSGLWLNGEQEAAIRVEICGDSLCGRIAWIREPRDEEGRIRSDRNNPDETLRGSPVLGLTILTGFPVTPDEAGDWKGGMIYDPKNGKTYRSRMSLDTRDTGVLLIRGFIGIPLFGRTTRWTRVSEKRLREEGGSEIVPPREESTEPSDPGSPKRSTP